MIAGDMNPIIGLSPFMTAAVERGTFIRPGPPAGIPIPPIGDIPIPGEGTTVMPAIKGSMDTFNGKVMPPVIRPC